MHKVGMGLIGVGHRGAQHAVRLARDFSDRCRVVALADARRQSLDAALAQLGEAAQPEVTESWHDVLARDDVDAVCVATPQSVHHEIVMAAFAAGKHVYCEKPLALTVADCDAMIAAAGAAGKVFVVGQQMRYHPHLHRMRALIDAGEIGTPQMMWLKEFRNPFPRHMAWAFDRGTSGGALVEKSCHHFDVFAWILGAPALRVFASGGQAVHGEIFGHTSDIVDHAWVTVEHEGGRKAMLGLCLFAGAPHEREGGAGTHMREIGVAGTHGMINTEGFHLGRNLEVRYRDKADVMRIALDPARGRRDALFERDGGWGIWVDFFDCIATGRRPVATGEVGRDALAVALAAERSIDAGEAIPCSPAGDPLPPAGPGAAP